MNGRHRNPDDGDHSNYPTDALSPRWKDDALITSRLELDNHKNQDDLQQESNVRAELLQI